MCKLSSCLLWASLVLLFGGCTTTVTEPLATDEEPVVRAKFEELQSAVKNHAAERVWQLLDKKSQTDAERVATDMRTAYAKANPEQKAQLEKTLALSVTDISDLTGVGFLNSQRFQGKYQELPDSKIDKVVVQGENATVYYIEPDGDHEKLILVRQNGQWKIWLAIPKVALP
jgi:hypothetical protein